MKTHLKYREKPLELNSCFDVEDVIKAEEILKDNGVSHYSDVGDEFDLTRGVLNDVIQDLLGIDIYEPIYNDEEFHRRSESCSFRGVITKEGVINAEQTLSDYMEDVDETDTVLQAVCYALFDLELYDEKYNDEGVVMPSVTKNVKINLGLFIRVPENYSEDEILSEVREMINSDGLAEYINSDNLVSITNKE